MLATLTDAIVSELFVGSAEGAEIHIHVLGTEVVFIASWHPREDEIVRIKKFPKLTKISRGFEFPSEMVSHSKPISSEFQEGGKPVLVTVQRAGW